MTTIDASVVIVLFKFTILKLRPCPPACEPLNHTELYGWRTCPMSGVFTGAATP
jgi:hypothetical protein